MSKKFSSFLVLGLGLFISTSADAGRQEQTVGQNRASPFMQEFGRALPPIGHVGFCRRYPRECKGPELLRTRFDMTAKRRQEMKAINDMVNEMILPVTDQELYGRVEHWTYPASKGDCEDYVLLKRRLLMERGWPAGALLITVVRDEDNEGHAVLTVRTAQGDFVLDNKRAEILAWNKVPYTFIKRQAHWNPQLWISLAAPSPRKSQNMNVSTNIRNERRVSN